MDPRRGTPQGDHFFSCLFRVLETKSHFYSQQHDWFYKKDAILINQLLDFLYEPAFIKTLCSECYSCVDCTLKINAKLKDARAPQQVWDLVLTALIQGRAPLLVIKTVMEKHGASTPQQTMFQKPNDKYIRKVVKVMLWFGSKKTQELCFMEYYGPQQHQYHFPKLEWEVQRKKKCSAFLFCFPLKRIKLV